MTLEGRNNLMFNNRLSKIVPVHDYEAEHVTEQTNVDIGHKLLQNKLFDLLEQLFISLAQFFHQNEYF